MNKRPLPLLADPFPMYKALREQAPVHWDPSFECWILTRFRDVASVLTDPRFSADRSKSQHRFAKMMRHEQAEFGPFGRTATMINTDPPAHARLRRLVSHAFTARLVDSLRPRIEAIVDDLLDSTEKNREFDLASKVATPLPVIMIA